jgi:hypothetical protein
VIQKVYLFIIKFLFDMNLEKIVNQLEEDENLNEN